MPLDRAPIAAIVWMIAIGHLSCAWLMPKTRWKKSGVQNRMNHQTWSTSSLAPTKAQVRR